LEIAKERVAVKPQVENHKRRNPEDNLWGFDVYGFVSSWVQHLSNEASFNLVSALSAVLKSAIPAARSARSYY
jgi:hypothetical protein